MSAIDRAFADQFKYLSEQLIAWRDVAPKLQPLADRLEKMEIEPRFDGSSLHLYVTGDKKQLTRVWRMLRVYGYNTSPENRPKDKQPSVCVWFDHQDNGTRVYFNFTSTVCKRVQIGTEMREVPVYEVRCE